MAGQVAPGTGHDFAGTTGVTYKTNILNGLGIARFGGANGNTLTSVNPSALTAAHVFMVIKVVTEATATGVWHFGTSGSANHYAFTDNNIYDGTCSTTRRTVGDPAPALTDWRVVEVVSTSGEWTFKLDGAQLFTTATNTVGINTSCQLGRGNNNKECDIAGVYFCSAKLSSGDRTDLITYINNRFGLSSS